MGHVSTCCFGSRSNKSGILQYVLAIKVSLCWFLKGSIFIRIFLLLTIWVDIFVIFWLWFLLLDDHIWIKLVSVVRDAIESDTSIFLVFDVIRIDASSLARGPSFLLLTVTPVP